MTLNFYFDYDSRIITKKMMKNVCLLASSCRFIKKQCMLVANNFHKFHFQFYLVYESE